MDNLINVFLILIIVFIMAIALQSAKKKLKKGCCSGNSYKVKKIKSQDKNIAHYPHNAVAIISGMSCENCKTRVENSLNSIDGCYCRVNLKTKTAQIYSKFKLEESDIKKAVEKNGYKVDSVEYRS